ncbi:hypothetical protein BCF74_11211 [Knoellia remsis]|uniref:Uncharacterized protein n=2 Tax=Knoellia remsis TaxID=407159 RepID=A0A2T0UJX7_9MICO|nr:hypothetical protein BCF74_11211 [Knoellia remsis]
MSNDRRAVVTVRLLAAASALTAIGASVSLWLSWRMSLPQVAPDGTTADIDVPFAQRALSFMYDVSFRQVGVAVLVGAALVVIAAMALRRVHPRVAPRRLRWEVLGAGALVSVPLGVLVAGHLYILTAPPDPVDGGWIGVQPYSQMALANLAFLGAAVLLLAAAGVSSVPAADDTKADEGEADQEEAEGLGALVSGERVDADGPPSSVVTSPTADTARDEVVTDDPPNRGREWSPEDFRRPS